MDDIVTRLRMQSTALKLHRFGDIMDDWYSEAADEIERLRALLQHGLTQGYDCKGCDLCIELKAIHEKAVRNA